MGDGGGASSGGRGWRGLLQVGTKVYSDGSEEVGSSGRRGAGLRVHPAWRCDGRREGRKGTVLSVALVGVKVASECNICSA